MPVKSDSTSFFFNYKTILYIFLFYYLAVAIRLLYYADMNNHPWILQDWLINYQDGGFKRRGLSGSFFFGIQDITGIRLQYIVFAFQVSLFLFLFRNLFLILYNKLVTPVYFTLFFSPIAFMLPLLENTIIGRKELMMLTLFSWLVYLLANKKLTKTKEYIILVLLFIAVFFHEIVIFYLPYFIIALFAFNGNKFEWARFARYAAVVIIPSAAIYFLGGEVNEGDSFRLLKDRGVVFQYTGMLNWNENAFEYISLRWNSFWWYFITLALVAIHFMIFFKSDNRVPHRIQSFLLLAFLYSIPLFIMATDWGRWMYIHMFMLIVLLGSMQMIATTWRESAIKPDKWLLIAVVVMIINFSWKTSHTDQGFLFRWQTLPTPSPWEKTYTPEFSPE